MTTDMFWPVFAAILSANLLTVMFVWAAVTYSRHEKNGTAGGSGSHGPALTMVGILAFLSLSLMVALDSVPAWLDTAMQ